MCRVPVESVSIQAHGLGSAFVPAVRSADNYFLRTGDGPYQLPLTITVTSILGDTVEDVVHAGDPSTEALIRGAVQFPEHTDLGVVTEAPARASGPSPKPTTPSPSPVPKPHPKPSSKRKPTPRPAGPCKRPLQPYGASCALAAGACAAIAAGIACTGVSLTQYSVAPSLLQASCLLWPQLVSKIDGLLGSQNANQRPECPADRS